MEIVKNSIQLFLCLTLFLLFLDPFHQSLLCSNDNTLIQLKYDFLADYSSFETIFIVLCSRIVLQQFQIFKSNLLIRVIVTENTIFFIFELRN